VYEEICKCRMNMQWIFLCIRKCSLYLTEVEFIFCCRYETELLGGEKYVSCSVALPAFCHVSRVMESSDGDPAYIYVYVYAFSRRFYPKRLTNGDITSYIKLTINYIVGTH